MVVIGVRLWPHGREQRAPPEPSRPGEHAHFTDARSATPAADPLAPAKEHPELGNDLGRVLERDEFGVCYEPKAHLMTGKTLGPEALVRWEHPEAVSVRSSLDLQ